MVRRSIEDLKRMKESLEGMVRVREGGHRVEINVCMGDCGMAAGARKIVTAILDEISQREVHDVIVTISGCAGLCKHEPMITVQMPDTPSVRYGNLNVEKVREIFREHILGARVVEKYVLAEESEKVSS